MRGGNITNVSDLLQPLKQNESENGNVKANIKGMSHTTCLCCIFSLSQKVCLYDSYIRHIFACFAV